MSPSAQTRIAVLLSVGQHPVTGRLRRADQDARALELAMQLPGVDVQPIHVGSFSAEHEAALRGYLGMGIGHVNLLELHKASDDVLPRLEQGVRDLQSNVILCGQRAEMGEGSGLLPYLLAKQLGWPIVSGLVSIEALESGSVTLLQALPRGQRRKLKVSLPAVLTLDTAAPNARQAAFGPAQRGTFTLTHPMVGACTAHESPSAIESALWHFQPAKKRPKRLKIIKATSARERFKAAAAKAESTGGKVLSGAAADVAADEIIKLLLEEGVLNLEGHP